MPPVFAGVCVYLCKREKRSDRQTDRQTDREERERGRDEESARKGDRHVTHAHGIQV